MLLYKIADIVFCFHTDNTIQTTKEFRKFKVEAFETGSNIFEIYFKNINDSTFRFDANAPRWKSWTSGNAKWSQRNDEHKYCCKFTMKVGRGYLSFIYGTSGEVLTDFELFNLIDLTGILEQYDAFVLHSSVIKSNGKAILFTGESGIGKSTQANLWKQYAEAEILNGDRAIIRCVKNRWYVFGLPFCGTSQICENFSIPILQIVVLGQSRKNTITEPNKFQTAINIIKQSSVWETQTERGFNLINNLVNNVNCCEMKCLPDSSAVKTLKSYMEKKTCLI